MDSSLHEIDYKCLAIVKFGPPHEDDGQRPATYYQVTIDPVAISPSGEYIRFGGNPGDEITGWQRCEALTVIEILGEWDADKAPHEQTFTHGNQGKVTMRMVD